MKQFTYAAAVVIGYAVAASAQSGTAADKMSQDKMGKGMEQSMMVTGCVAESGGRFMLNNAMMSGDKMGGAMGSGTTGSGGTGTMGSGSKGSGSTGAGGTGTTGSGSTGSGATGSGSTGSGTTGSGSMGSGSTGGGGSMASGSSMSHAMSYELTGGTLKPHVGHKVEVTGMMQPMSKDTMGKPGMAKEGMAKEGTMNKDMMMGGTIAVKNLKMISSTCS